MKQQTLFADTDDALDWTFKGASTRELTHCYHDYPARMIPQVAGQILDLYGAQATTLFDPYCGTGTTLVEGLRRGLNVIGTDLNPLARLIAQAKTTVPDLTRLDRTLRALTKWVQAYRPAPQAAPAVAGISRLDFWFKEDVIQKLQAFRQWLAKIDDPAVKLFFQVAFSETVRDCSNTRNEEFKLYRYEAKRLATFAPSVFALLTDKLARNRAGLVTLLAQLPARRARVAIHDFNTVTAIPPQHVPERSVDLVVTSPPYGDSQTTVAYGQYSRLSAAWLELEAPATVDRRLMGGQTVKQFPALPCPSLQTAIAHVARVDESRALEVASFYADLWASIANVAQVVKPHGYACYVVGNRKVKGVVLPTNTAVQDFFTACGFTHRDTFTRSIPNKRMPSQNSPSNVAGQRDQTMTHEYIVIMQRR